MGSFPYQGTHLQFYNTEELHIENGKGYKKKLTKITNNVQKNNKNKNKKVSKQEGNNFFKNSILIDRQK